MATLHALADFHHCRLVHLQLPESLLFNLFDDSLLVWVELIHNLAIRCIGSLVAHFQRCQCRCQVKRVLATLLVL